MRIYLKPALGISIALLVAIGVISVALAQSTGNYEITWWTIDSGGSSNGNGYILQGVIGHPATASASGGDYTMIDGFYTWLTDLFFRVFIPLITR